MVQNISETFNFESPSASQYTKGRLTLGFGKEVGEPVSSGTGQKLENNLGFNFG